ncbi:MAG: flagellar basal body P-ring formation protein FlgA [Pseudooceanicola sp.]|nr:flagellar basal body P-ring formation protein FlgA [Pseudooceanicola sp.]
MLRLSVFLTLLASQGLAEVLVPARTIRPREIITGADLLVKSAEVPGALTHPDEAIGMEARVALYPGRPVHPADIGPPALIDRNALVQMVFRRGALDITAEGRALDRAGVGDLVRVMNLASRSTVTGIVRPDGVVEVN